jgi:hypothetical protein
VPVRVNVTEPPAQIVVVFDPIVGNVALEHCDFNTLLSVKPIKNK